MFYVVLTLSAKAVVCVCVMYGVWLVLLIYGQHSESEGGRGRRVWREEGEEWSGSGARVGDMMENERGGREGTGEKEGGNYDKKGSE